LSPVRSWMPTVLRAQELAKIRFGHFLGHMKAVEPS
jgi:hypothetical protein